MELDTIWKDRGIRKELKMKLVKALIWPVITYGAEGWTLKKDDERRLEAAEMNAADKLDREKDKQEHTGWTSN